MNADASHSRLRTKRCLPAKLHWKPAHYDLPGSPIHPSRWSRPKASPKSREDDTIGPKSANSRFFTDCYPISAVFAPRPNQIAPALDAIPSWPMQHRTDN
jgi:hypothetical protein